ncbi:MAG TPA: hypothetical protein VFN67_26140 [Polyangiales bacterium]|nr:hypothetical protein [Polyangiales bacterium]
MRGALDAPWVTRWLWVLPLLAAIPAVLTGYVLDDLQQQSMVRGTYDAVQRGPDELYCFSLGPGQGIDPAILSWWDDPQSSLCFLRPISSFSLWVDHEFLWQWPALPHLHSIVWFIALWCAWRAILMRYLPTRIANLALLLTATSGALAMTVGWIASRHALVGGTFGIAGLYHCLASRDPVNSRNSSRSARELLGYGLIALGLLSSEMVLGVFGFLVAREWLTRDPQQTLRRRALARIVFYALCGLTYVSTHARLGYGAPKYPLYLNASGDPWTFLRSVPERLLSLCGDLVLGLPSDLWVYPSMFWALVAVCALAALLLILALRRLWPALQDPSLSALRWLGVGGLLSLAPALSGMAGGRALTIAAFPAYALIAAFLLSGDSLLGAAGTRRRRMGEWTRRLLAVGVLIGNPLAHFGWFYMLYEMDQTGEKSLPDSQVQCGADADVYMVDASEQGAAAWYARYWLKDKLQAKNYHQLTMSPLGVDRIVIKRTGPARLTMRAIGGPLVGEMAIPPGSGDVFTVGMTRKYPDYSVQVKELSKRGPVEADFEFARTLDDPQLCVFIQDDAHLYQWKPPAVGSDYVIEAVSPFQFVSQSVINKGDSVSLQTTIN